MSAPLLCITGPTAAGKSAVSRALAQRWPIEIINVDSATIYRGMDIGTAKPTPAERALITHHLLDICDPAQAYSAAAFCKDAQAHIDAIRARGHLPVLCGGTMLYYKALQDGLNPLPSAQPHIREAINAQAQQQGWPALHAELARIDPSTAARLSPNDQQRIQRALEIYQSSGHPMSWWLAKTQPTPPSGLALHIVSLEPSTRAGLHTRIAQRFGQMMEDGFLEEVLALYQRGDLHLGLPSMRCVGYRQLWQHVAGELGRDTAVEQAIAATRQLAKRQLTWLRSMNKEHTIDCLAHDATAQVVDAVAGLIASGRVGYPHPR